jgi:hypothetical protein
MRHELMTGSDDVPAREFTTSSWSPAGIATLHAAGHDPRSALEAGLHAVLALAVEPAPTSLNTGRSAPIRGEGDDLASLFADLVEDLLEQIEFFPGGLQDVAVDGVLRREDGGYVGWGYASGTLEAASSGEVPHLLGAPTANEDAIQGVVVHATLQRP